MVIVVGVVAMLGAAAAAMGGICIHEAVEFDLSAVQINATGIDALGLRTCGSISRDLPPQAQAWHHGMLLGVGLLTLSAAWCSCVIGWCGCRRRRRKRLVLQANRPSEVRSEHQHGRPNNVIKWKPQCVQGLHYGE